MKKFYDEIYETVDLELLQISTQLDNELESMLNIVGQLTLTGTIHDASEAENPLALSPTITYLSALTSANPFYPGYRSDSGWEKNTWPPVPRPAGRIITSAAFSAFPA